MINAWWSSSSSSPPPSPFYLCPSVLKIGKFFCRVLSRDFVQYLSTRDSIWDICVENVEKFIQPQTLICLSHAIKTVFAQFRQYTWSLYDLSFHKFHLSVSLSLSLRTPWWTHPELGTGWAGLSSFYNFFNNKKRFFAFLKLKYKPYPKPKLIYAPVLFKKPTPVKLTW